MFNLFKKKLINSNVADSLDISPKFNNDEFDLDFFNYSKWCL